MITHVAAGCKISLFALDSASNIAAPLQRMPQNRAVVDAERGRSLAVQKKEASVAIGPQGQFINSNYGGISFISLFVWGRAAMHRSLKRALAIAIGPQGQFIKSSYGGIFL